MGVVAARRGTIASSGNRIPLGARQALRAGLAVDGQGFLCQNFDRWAATAYRFNGVVYYDDFSPNSLRITGGLGLLKGDTCTAVILDIAAAPTLLTSFYLGLYDMALNLLCSTADESTNPALNTPGFVALTWTAPYTAPDDRAVYMGATMTKGGLDNLSGPSMLGAGATGPGYLGWNGNAVTFAVQSGIGTTLPNPAGPLEEPNNNTIPWCALWGTSG